jgi:hypothetical protein
VVAAQGPLPPPPGTPLPLLKKAGTAMTEAALPPSGQGTVVLDIGADTGALVLHTPAELDGHEIEISRAGSSARTHSQVRQRHVGGTVHYAAVYPGLHAGDYVLWRDSGAPAMTVTITGGQVTSAHWSF